jgi:hypothetical protein
VRFVVTRARAWLGGSLLGLVLVAIGFTAVHKQVRDGNDFPLYWQGARDLIAGGSPYDVASGLHGYVYLPWFAWMLAPMALLPLPAAAACWYAANVAFLLLAVRESVAALRAAGLAPRTRTLLLASLPLAALAHDNLVLGQANLFLLWLIAAATRGALEPRGSSFTRGAALGVATALKMSAGVLVMPWLRRLRTRLLVACFAGVAFVLLAPLVISGPARGLAQLRDWHAKVVAPAGAGTLQGSKVIDQSVHAGLRRLLVDEPAFGETRVNVASLGPRAFARVSLAVATVLLVYYMLVVRVAPAQATGRSQLLDLALGCCAMVQVTGFNLKAQFIVLLLPAWASASLAFGPKARAPRGTRALLLAAAALFLLSQPGLVGRAASNWLLAYSAMSVGTLLLAATLVKLRFATRRGD